jgi:glycosyltransferase involved in cell wall biosynthesis/GT2 family glycosyltransferase
VESVEAKIVRLEGELGIGDVTVARHATAATQHASCGTGIEEDLAIRLAKLERLVLERHGAAAETVRDREELARLSAEVEKLGAELRAVHESTSWKVTAPMRAIKNAALDIGSGLRRVVLRSTPWPRASAGHRKLISDAGLFDGEYYARQAPDLRDSGLDPLVHYLTRGAAEGLDPHPLFDSSFYLERHPDVAASGTNPLVHYLRTGAAQGRDPHPLFETSFYLEQKPHVAALGVNPLVHFLAEGPTPAFDPFSSPTPLPDTAICVVTPDIVGPVKNGGIGTACYHFARILGDVGQPVTILYTCDLSPSRQAHWRNTYARMGIKFLSLVADAPPMAHEVRGSTWFLDRSWRVFKYLEGKSYSLVHFQDWHANGFWSIKAKRLGLAFDRTTLTVATHSCTKWIDEGMRRFGPEPIETAKLVWVETYGIEHCDVLLSPNRYMLDWLSRSGIRTPPSVFVAPNPYTEHTDVDRPPREIDHDHLIFFGLLATRKGLHVFGDALRQLRREGGPLPRTLSFLGTLDEVNGRPAAEYLETLRRDLAPIEFHVINHLDHLGARDYIERTRGLVVIPSLLENCPFVVIECIENGFPFLAARTGGIPDMVDPTATFEPTPAALAARLGERHSIDHAAMRHPYSAREAAQVWRDLHSEWGPLGVTARRAREPARNVREPTRVSVCIRFSEDAPYLERVVAAFADQRYPDLEVVVVNHGSGPEASREFDRVAARHQDGRFRFVTTENEGPGAARNFAADRAAGDLLLFFEAADLPKTSDFVATMVRALHRSGADCLTCACDVVDAVKLRPTEGDVTSTYRPIGACLEVGFFQNVLGDATMILPRTVFAQLGGFPVKRASWEVQEFLLRLCFRGFRLETFPEALFYYRESASGRSRQANYFLEFQSLFEQLEGASREELAHIMETVGGPTLVARLGAGFAHLIGR